MTAPITKGLLKDLIRRSQWETIGTLFNFKPRYHFGKIAPPAFFDWSCVPQAVFDVLQTPKAQPKKKTKRDKRRAAGPWRRRLYVAQKGICFYCERPTLLEDFTIEHRQPLSRGGTHEAMNKVGTCRECNNAKGFLTEGEFLALEPANVKGLIKRAQKKMREFRGI